MVTVRRAPPSVPVVKSAPKASITAKDAETAGKLRDAINELLTRVRMTRTPAGKEPVLDQKAGLMRAPNGHLLFPVVLQTPPPGAADMFTTSAQVDPLTNTFYVAQAGGFAGRTFFNGPLALPKGLEFHHKTYSKAQLALLAAAAVKATKPAAFHASPDVLSASYFPGMGVRPPPGVDAGPAVNLRVVFPNITYVPTTSVKVDEKTRTLTVVVDASSGNPYSKAMARPVDLKVPVPRLGHVGETWTLLVKDYQGKVLDRSTFENFLPR